MCGGYSVGTMAYVYKSCLSHASERLDWLPLWTSHWKCRQICHCENSQCAWASAPCPESGQRLAVVTLSHVRRFSTSISIAAGKNVQFQINLVNILCITCKRVAVQLTGSKEFKFAATSR